MSGKDRNVKKLVSENGKIQSAIRLQHSVIEKPTAKARKWFERKAYSKWEPGKEKCREQSAETKRTEKKEVESSTDHRGHCDKAGAGLLQCAACDNVSEYSDADQ